ncbi:MAG: hypothetical protein VXZ35_02855 [Pseudomonadota bacterium]|nr:hypothetical protein [Pseudomonadota bacterium]
MTDANYSEQRSLPRHLCNDQFSSSTLEIDDVTYQLQSINFHHQGIGLFGPERLPAAGNCAISFSYQDEDSALQIEQLPCILIYSNETEVGNQYGIRFNLNHIDQETLSKLLDIEKRLESSEDSSGRYGLFQD